MRDRVWKVAGPLLAASLLLPWWYGTSDGDELTIPGWDTEPGFTLAMLGCACGILVAGLTGRSLVALPSAVAAIALTVWMLPRGETFSGYDLGPGGFVALAVAVVALVPAIPRPSRRYA